MFNEIFNNLIKLNQIFDKNKKVVIFGAGAGGKATFFVLKTLSISPICFVDNDPSLMGSKMFDIPIEKPSYLLNINKDEFIVLVSSIYYEEISGQLMDLGFKESHNYFRMINPRKPNPRQPKLAILKETTYFSEFGFSVGKYTYGYQQFFSYKCLKPLLESIGAFCSIAKNVTIVIENHPLNHISTHSFYYRKNSGFIEEDRVELLDKVKNKKVIIGNDVWIGANVTILPNVIIGDGAVIGAGAVITKDVPDYAIVVGAPGRVIRYRFSREEIDILMVELAG